MEFITFCSKTGFFSPNGRSWKIHWAKYLKWFFKVKKISSLDNLEASPDYENIKNVIKRKKKLLVRDSWLKIQKTQSRTFTFQKNCFICFNERPLKVIKKNAFCFILKALFVCKIFKSLSWLLGHVEKTAWFEKWDL